MATSYRPHPQADRAEREITEYLKQLGFFIVPAANFGQNGAPMVEAADKYRSIVMPDQIGMRGGRCTAFDVKWKSNAAPWRNANNRLFTGIDENSYLHYRRFEIASGMHVVIVFCHEKENEVRCGTLDRLEENRAPNGPAASYGKGGMHNWWYEDILQWMTLSELRLCVRDRILSPVEIPAACWGKIEQPTEAPKSEQLSMFGDHDPRTKIDSLHGGEVREVKRGRR